MASRLVIQIVKYDFDYVDVVSEVHTDKSLAGAKRKATGIIKRYMESADCEDSKLFKHPTAKGKWYNRCSDDNVVAARYVTQTPRGRSPYNILIIDQYDPDKHSRGRMFHTSQYYTD